MKVGFFISSNKRPLRLFGSLEYVLTKMFFYWNKMSEDSEGLQKSKLKPIFRTVCYVQSNLVIRNVLIRNKLVLRNHFPWPIWYLLHKNKEHLALRNNFRVTKKFLITKFDCTLLFYFDFYILVLCGFLNPSNNLISNQCRISFDGILW